MIKLRTNSTVLAIVTKANRPGECKEQDYDAAVAHALIQAVSELKEARITRGGRSDIISWLHYRAAEILRTDFGIIEESP